MVAIRVHSVPSLADGGDALASSFFCSMLWLLVATVVFLANSGLEKGE